MIDSGDLRWANVLWQTLRTCPRTSSAFRHILDQYSRMFLCPQHRSQIDIHHKTYWQKRLDAWTDRFRPEADILEGNWIVDSLGVSGVSAPTVALRYENASRSGSISSAPTSPGTPHDMSDGGMLRQRSGDPGFDRDFHRRNKSEPQAPGQLRSRKLGTSKVGLPLYQPYVIIPGAPSSLEDTITSPLTIEDSKTGYIYAYRRVSDNVLDGAHLRIGHTAYKLDGAIHMWSNQCQYSLQLICHPVRVRNAARVASLIHKELELDGRRRMDFYCKVNHKRCQTTHHNWFEIDEDSAETVIQYWAWWMEVHKPYDITGRMNEDLMKTFNDNTEVTFAGRLIKNKRDFYCDSKGRCWKALNRVRPGSRASSSSIDPARTSKLRNCPPIPRRRASLSLQTIEPTSPQWLRDNTSRSKSIACLRSRSQINSVNRRASSADGRAEVTIATYNPKFLRRTQRNSSLREATAHRTPDLEIKEAQIVRLQKGRSIYIPAPTPKKISVHQKQPHIQQQAA